MDMGQTLEEALHNLEVDRSYTCVKTLKESESETTQLVVSVHGARCIRKYLTNGNLGAGYRVLASIQSLYLPQVLGRYHLPDAQVVILGYREGLDLRGYVDGRGPLPAEQAVSIVSDVACALVALHTRGSSPVVHRDVTPSNVIVSKWGRASLIDLGIAREVRSDLHHDTQILGTRGYAAPEQLGFAQSDERTDIYALGPLLYFMLTGEDPRQDLWDRLAVDDRVPDALRTIIRRCLAYEPSRRYQSAREFLKALDCIQLPQIRSGEEHGVPVPFEAVVPNPAEVLVPRSVTPDPIVVPPPLPTVSSEPVRHYSRVHDIAHRVLAIGGVIVYAPFLIIGMTMPWTDSLSPTIQDLIINIISDWSIVLFLCTPLYFLLCNPFKWMDKVPFYRERRLRRVIATFAVCLFLLFILVGVSTQFYSPQHFALLSSR